MAFEKLMYRSAGGTITGNLAGKLINFSARPGRAGGQPPPGEYDIHPPVNDPVYGWVALMTPSGNLGSDLNKHKVSPSFMKVSPSFLKEAPSGMKDVPALGFQKVEPAAKICFAPAIKYCYSPKTNVADGGRFASGVKGTPGTARTVFVLSSRPILGQNSLVVMLGHADLMDALQSAGGATVTVS